MRKEKYSSGIQTDTNCKLGSDIKLRIVKLKLNYRWDKGCPINNQLQNAQLTHLKKKEGLQRVKRDKINSNFWGITKNPLWSTGIRKSVENRVNQNMKCSGKICKKENKMTDPICSANYNRMRYKI